MAEKSYSEWREWSGEIQLARTSDWPWPSRGINVNHSELAGLAADMQRSSDYFYTSEPTPWSYQTSVNLWKSGDTPGPDFGHSSTFQSQLENLESSPLAKQAYQDSLLPGSWRTISRMQLDLAKVIDVLAEAGREFHWQYSNIGGMLATTSANYTAAEEAFMENRDLLLNTTSGSGTYTCEEVLVDHMDDNEDVSPNDYSVIKKFFDRSAPEDLIFNADVLRKVANQFEKKVDQLEGFALRASKALPEEMGELIGESMRKFHGSAQALAYVAGKTSDVCDSFGISFKNYKQSFENVTESYDVRFRPDELWADLAGDAHDKARDHLREFNRMVFYEHGRLPGKLHIILPRLPGIYGNTTIDALREGWLDSGRDPIEHSYEVLRDHDRRPPFAEGPYYESPYMYWSDDAE
ncbi:hypothetical protein [Nonomuraea sp. KM88]|uniref:hypothetical protein n=1 Tax=Nonomuraea sp. KM88 TaxID=3457427 RepID=UPI003FCC4E74